jgi:hypothetical protein
MQEIELPGRYLLGEFAPYIDITQPPEPGKEWRDLEAVFALDGHNAGRYSARYQLRVAGNERVRVPLGEFDTVRIELRTAAILTGGNAVVVYTYWYGTRSVRPVKIRRQIFSSYGPNSGEDSYELARAPPGELAADPASPAPGWKSEPHPTADPLPRPPRSVDPAPQTAQAEGTAKEAEAPLASSLVRAGDSWTYNIMQGSRRNVGTLTMTVMEVDGDQIQDKISHSGFRSFAANRSFKAGFDPKAPVQETELPGRFRLAEFAPYVGPADLPTPGNHWNDLEGVFGLDMVQNKDPTKFEVHAVKEERVQVPAGDVNAVRVEARTMIRIAGIGYVTVVYTYWYSPQWRRPVKIRRQTLSPLSTWSGEDSFEMVSARQTQ